MVLALGGYTFLGGMVSFLGYVLDIHRFTDWANDGISIQPNAALCVVLSGSALMCLARNRRRVSGVLGALVLLTGGSTLLEWIVGGSFGHDAWFLFGRQWGRTGVVHPGQMGPPGSLSWTLIGAMPLRSGSGPEMPRAPVVERSMRCDSQEPRSPPRNEPRGVAAATLARRHEARRALRRLPVWESYSRRCPNLLAKRSRTF